MDVEFRDEIPVSAVRQSWYTEFATALRAHPGKWGKLPYPGKSKPHQVVSNINQGRIVALPKEEFEARTFEDAIWVRYHGHQS